MSETVLTTQLQSKLPDVLRPLFMRLTQQAIATQALRGMPVGEGSQEYLILQDAAAAAWLAATHAQLLGLLKSRAVPPELAPLIDAPLLEAMLAKTTRAGVQDKKKGGQHPAASAPGQGKLRTTQPVGGAALAGAADEPAA